MPCDVIVAGAGPAGAFTALLLARAGVDVELFDRAAFPRAKLCGDTLNPGAVRILTAHLPIDTLLKGAVPLTGMLLTGPRIQVTGSYEGVSCGWSIGRRTLDQRLVGHAIGAGVRFRDAAAIVEPTTDDRIGKVNGVLVSSRQGREVRHARMVIAADGRGSRLARAFGLARHPSRPRRWAIGAYYANVMAMGCYGEMHVRRTHYLGIAPVAGGLANVCLVVPHGSGGGGWRDPAVQLQRAIEEDSALRQRFARAQLVAAPQVMGPMAVDARDAGVPGMLLAGDAAGFIDPMTGDGIRLALSSAELTARVTLDVLNGTLDSASAVLALRKERGRVLRNKWRFNRAVRALVASPSAVTAAAFTARIAPRLFQRTIRYAGDAG